MLFQAILICYFHAVYSCNRYTPEQEKQKSDGKPSQEICEALGYGYKFTNVRMVRLANLFNSFYIEG